MEVKKKNISGGELYHGFDAHSIRLVQRDTKVDIPLNNISYNDDVEINNVRNQLLDMERETFHI